MPLEAYLVKLVELLVAPFTHLPQVWTGIVPLYGALIYGEMYERRVNYGHAVGNGCVMLWAGLLWALHQSDVPWFRYLGSGRDLMTIAWTVTAATIGLGMFTVVLGVRRKDRKLCEILGHPRFSGYFLILLYPLQTGLIPWNMTTLAAILIFALPIWLLLYLTGRLLTRWVK